MNGFTYDKSLALILEERKYSQANIVVEIEWNKALSVKAIDEDELDDEDNEIAEIENIVYIFVGYNNKGQKAYDVGQTSQSLSERVKQHVYFGDYLEGYPNKQIIYCGRVTNRYNRALFEQIEGALIQHLDKKELCLSNESKRHNYKKPYAIQMIYNLKVPSELKDVVSRRFNPMNDIKL